jgi:hypothetical protein
MALNFAESPTAPTSPTTPPAQSEALQALSKRRADLLIRGSSASTVVLPELFLHVELKGEGIEKRLEFVDCEDGQVQFVAEKSIGWILREGTQKVSSDRRYSESDRLTNSILLRLDRDDNARKALASRNRQRRMVRFLHEELLEKREELERDGREAIQVARGKESWTTARLAGIAFQLSISLSSKAS